MKNKILILFLSLSSIINAQIYIDNDGNVYDKRQTTENKIKQSEQKTVKSNSKFDPRRLEFGGNLGLQFGSYTLVNISPQVGYKFSNKFSAGVGIGYTYYGNDRHYNDFEEHFASINLYGTFYPLNFIVLSVQPEINHMWQSYKINGYKEAYNKFVPSVVLGGGIRYGSLLAQIKYDIVQDDYSPYGNKIFYSIGYTFGF